MTFDDVRALLSTATDGAALAYETALAFARAEPILSVSIGAGVLLLLTLLYGVKRRRVAGVATPAPTLPELAQPESRVAAPEPSALEEAEPPAIAQAELPASAEAAPPALPEPEPLAARAPEPALVHPAPVEAPVAVPAPAALRPVRLRDRLRRTSEALVGRLESVLVGRRVDAAVIDDLEQVLYTADLGVRTAESLLATVRKQAAGGDAAAVRAALRGAILEKLRRVEPPAGSALSVTGKPHVILVLGVNGSGKTTTIGKLAGRYQASGRRVVLGAGDTFRAAAIEQLQVWGERVGCEVIAGKPGGDPSAVAFDTVRAAVARGADVAICDTAGRLQTKLPLIEELKKIVRVLAREIPGAPHESLLVLDANTGQNALSQARVFTEAAQVTGLVLTKLDGTAKGGVLVGLADELGIPVRYVGVGEGVEDLRDFSAEEFVDAIFETDAPTAARVG